MIGRDREIPWMLANLREVCYENLLFGRQHDPMNAIVHWGSGISLAFQTPFRQSYKGIKR